MLQAPMALLKAQYDCLTYVPPVSVLTLMLPAGCKPWCHFIYACQARGTCPGVVVGGVGRERGMHERIAAAGAASEHHLDGARNGVLRVNQQGPLQLWHYLLHATAEGHLRAWRAEKTAAEPRQGAVLCRLRSAVLPPIWSGPLESNCVYAQEQHGRSFWSETSIRHPLVTPELTLGILTGSHRHTLSLRCL